MATGYWTGNRRSSNHLKAAGWAAEDNDCKESVWSIDTRLVSFRQQTESRTAQQLRKKRIDYQKTKRVNLNKASS